MKKVGVFIDRWMSGGIESYIVTNYENMNLADIKVTIITTRKFSDLYDERLINLGIDIIELLPQGKDSELTRTIISLKAFRQHLIANDYDVLHLNIYNGVSLVYSKIAYECGVEKIIAHSHNSAMGQVRLRSMKRLSHILGKIKYEKYVSDYWACSDLACDWLFRKKTKDKVVLMNNGIDTNKFRYNLNKREIFREKYGIKKDELLLGNVGRLNNQKNQVFLLDIAREVRKKGISFKMLIAGEGELKNVLQKKINEYNLIDNVRLIGTINDTPSFYSGIDIFLLPSLFEGNPIVGIEAQCAGVNCLFSDKITKQAKVIDKTKFLSLDSTNEWVKHIDMYREMNNNRESQCYDFKTNKYDILETSKTLKLNLVK